MSYRSIFISALAIGLAAVAVSASAGKREVAPVGISVEDNVAGGALADARGTPDNVQYIGCTTSWTYGSCIAVDADGRTGSCSSRDPDDLAIMRSIGPHSYVLFAWNGKYGTCSALSVMNYSVFIDAASSGH